MERALFTKMNYPQLSQRQIDRRHVPETVSVVLFLSVIVPASSPSRGGDAAVYAFDPNQPSLPTPFYTVRVSPSVFMALSTVFHSINSPDNPPHAHSVHLILFLPR